ncbi:MAG: amidohydrolase [Clostridia bacterium]|nr:amidohydrolase [Clostridia bacterium]
MKMDILIENARIITGFAGAMYAGRGFIGITGDEITYVGETAPEKTEVRKRIDAGRMIAMPGLMNAHTHSPMVLMRNYAADRTLDDWLYKSIIPIENKLTREHIRNGSMLAIAEMIKSGTTAFLDMYFDVDCTAEAALEAGIRANVSLGLLTSHNMNNGLEDAKAFCRKFYSRYHGAGNGLLRTSLEVHSVYLYNEGTLRDSAEFAAETGMTVNIHLHETKSEVERAYGEYGMSPIGICRETGLLDGPVAAAHTVWLTDQDMDIIKEKKVVPVHNPSSNMYLASGFAPVPEMLAKGIRVALGTDGAASNNDLDMFGEMHIAGLIHKGRTLDPTAVSAENVIEMACANGAQAMGFGASGTIRTGNKADIILVDADGLHNVPMLNPVNAMVYSTSGADVDTVIINGRTVMENRRLMTMDEEKIRYNLKKSASELFNI